MHQGAVSSTRTSQPCLSPCLPINVPAAPLPPGPHLLHPRPRVAGTARLSHAQTTAKQPPEAGLHSRAFDIIWTPTSWVSFPDKSPWIGSKGKGMVCAVSVTASCPHTSTGCTPDATAHTLRQSPPLRPSLVVPSSKVLPPYPTSSPLMADSGHRSLLVPETCGASASSTHLLRWWLTGMRGRGTIFSPCPLSRSGGPRRAVGSPPSSDRRLSPLPGPARRLAR